jgi:polyhydroxyalkanoate synthesis regulator phasin
MDYSRISLAFCKLRLRRGSELMTRSEASKRLLALRNQGSSEERRKLESQLREDALFQSRMEELCQSILPRLGEILRELLRCRRPISLPNESRAQLAINILCDEILSKGQMNAQHFMVYVDGDHETADRQEFARWQKQKIERAEQESSTRVTALREKVTYLETALNRRKLEEGRSRGPQTSNGDLQKKFTKLENERAADRLKIVDLEKQRVDNLTTLDALKVEFECVRSELQRVLQEGKSEASGLP